MKSRDFSGISYGRSVSAQTRSELRGRSGAFVSGREIRLPGNREWREQRPVRMRSLLRGESEQLVLA